MPARNIWNDDKRANLLQWLLLKFKLMKWNSRHSLLDYWRRENDNRSN